MLRPIPDTLRRGRSTRECQGPGGEAAAEVSSHEERHGLYLTLRCCTAVHSPFEAHMTRRSAACLVSRPAGGVSQVPASSATCLAAPSRRAAGSRQRPQMGQVCFRCYRGSLAFTLACGIAIGTWPAHAWAEELAAEAPARHGGSGDLRLSIGGVRAAFWQALTFESPSSTR